MKRSPHLTRAFFPLLLAALLPAASYANRPATYWLTPTGDFFDSTKWSLGAPSGNTDARIDNGGVVRITSPWDLQPVTYVYLGSGQYTDGTLEISGEGSATFTTMIVGALNATGTLNITDGGHLTSFGGPIGSDYLGIGFATVDGARSTWTVTGSQMVVGGNGTGTLSVQDSGTLNVANGTGKVLLGIHPLSKGDLFIGNGGTAGIIAASEIYNGEGPATVTFNHNEEAFAFAPKFTGYQTVNGYLNVRHEGTGTTIFTAPENSMAGTLTIVSGTVIINGLLTGSTKDVVSENEVEETIIIQEKTVGQTVILPDGTLGGTGFLEGNTTVGGILSPGMGAGVIHFGTDLSLETTGTVRMELGGKLRGTEFDGVDVAGKLLYGGTLSIVLLDGFELNDGDLFDLFDGYEEYEGTFENILFSAEGYAGEFDPQTGVLSVATVPEPSVVGLAVIGLAGLASRRRRVKPAAV